MKVISKWPNLWNSVKPFRNQSLLPIYTVPHPTRKPAFCILPLEDTGASPSSWVPASAILCQSLSSNAVEKLLLVSYIVVQYQQPGWDCMSRYNHCLQFAMWRVGFNKGHYFKYRGKSRAQVCSLFLKRPILVKCQWYYLVFYIIYQILN